MIPRFGNHDPVLGRAQRESRAPGTIGHSRPRLTKRLDLPYPSRMTETSAVYLCRVPDATPGRWSEAVLRLLDHADLAGFAGRNDRIAIKVHVGEPGLTTALPAGIAGAVARRLRALNAQPFFTDTAVLYSGRRSNGPAHAEVAVEHGFTLEGAGAVFLPADGMAGNLEVETSIGGRHFGRVGIAEAIAHANGAVIVSHATGHMLSGFGATLKNLGMGCASRKGKLLQHSDTKPFLKEEKCASCAACVAHCPTGALSVAGGDRVRFDESICTGCGECLAHCRTGAIGFQWDSGSASMQEKMVEHALGVVRLLKGNLIYLLGVVNLTQHCDCWAPGSPRVAPDIGFALSADPVAVDQAAMDLVAAGTGKRLDQIAWPELDGLIQLSYAESLGLGSRKYQLTEL
jgi:uncharacterized protein